MHILFCRRPSLNIMYVGTPGQFFIYDLDPSTNEIVWDVSKPLAKEVYDVPLADSPYMYTDHDDDAIIKATKTGRLKVPPPVAARIKHIMCLNINQPYADVLKCYQLLGLTLHATKEEIIAAFQRLIQNYPEYRNPEEYKYITSAYALLLPEEPKFKALPSIPSHQPSNVKATTSIDAHASSPSHQPSNTKATTSTAVEEYILQIPYDKRQSPTTYSDALAFIEDPSVELDVPRDFYFYIPVGGDIRFNPLEVEKNIAAVKSRYFMWGTSAEQVLKLFPQARIPTTNGIEDEVHNLLARNGGAPYGLFYIIEGITARKIIDAVTLMSYQSFIPLIRKSILCWIKRGKIPSDDFYTTLKTLVECEKREHADKKVAEKAYSRLYNEGIRPPDQADQESIVAWEEAKSNAIANYEKLGQRWSDAYQKLLDFIDNEFRAAPPIQQILPSKSLNPSAASDLEDISAIGAAAIPRAIGTFAPPFSTLLQQVLPITFDEVLMALDPLSFFQPYPLALKMITRSAENFLTLSTPSISLVQLILQMDINSHAPKVPANTGGWMNFLPSVRKPEVVDKAILELFIKTVKENSRDGIFPISINWLREQIQLIATRLETEEFKTVFQPVIDALKAFEIEAKSMASAPRVTLKI